MEICKIKGAMHITLNEVEHNGLYIVKQDVSSTNCICEPSLFFTFEIKIPVTKS